MTKGLTKYILGIAVMAVTINAQAQSDPGGVDCPTPENVTAGQVDQNSAVLSWSDANGALAYQVTGGLVGTNSTVSFIYEGTEVPANLLPACSEIYFFVQAICGENQMSAQSEVSRFTTECLKCDQPTAVSTSVGTDGVVVLSWADVLGADNYVIQGRAIGLEGPYVTLPVNGTSFTTDQLVVGLSYEWRVAAICEGQLSDPSDFQNFALPAMKVNFDQAEVEQKFEAYPNPATNQVMLQQGDEPSQVRILDISGQEALEVIIPEGSGEFGVDISALPAGVYFIQKLTTENPRTIRFVKE